jgi:CheY-like chemotaxis protein
MKTNRILVIDDNINATRVARLILERTGRYEVRELNDPVQALDIAREFEPDLILLDVCMPNIEGSVVAEKINSTAGFTDTPIVFLTCIVTPGEMGKSGTMIIGRHEYIAKPARPDILISCIERNLSRSSHVSRIPARNSLVSGVAEYAPS